MSRNPISFNIPHRVYDKATKAVLTVEFQLSLDPEWIVDMLAQKAFDTKAGRATVLRNSVTVKVVK
jgi:hypothetical protein